MITTVKADGVQEYAFIETLKKRAQNSDRNVIPVVSEILENVRENGDKAVREYTVKFDGKAPEHTEIPAEEGERRYHGSACARPEARRNLRSGRHRRASVVRSDERYPRQARGC